MQVELSRKNDGSEHVHYNTPDFPAYIHSVRLSSYPNSSAISHWHDDLEFLLVWSGHMNYNINGTTVTLQEGEGLFVNTRQIHNGFSTDFQECTFLCILLHPLLLCSSPYVEKNYVVPIMKNTALPYLILHPDREHEQQILALLKEMNRCRREALSAVKIQSLFFQILEHLFSLSDPVRQQPIPRNHQLSILKDMIRFIYENYTEKLTLAQISRAGKVGKTTCCAIFQKYTNDTPISYLTNYRLQKGVELLETTDKTILEICFASGFSGASYFTETFRRLYGCTPTEYRARKEGAKQGKIEKYKKGEQLS